MNGYNLGPAYIVPIAEPHMEKTRSWANDSHLKSLMMRNSYVSEEDQKNWLENIRSDATRVVFAVHSSADNTHVGNTGFYEISLEHRRANFWILIGDGNGRGKGIGAYVLGEMLSYGFRQLQLNRVQLLVRHDNTAALNLYKKYLFKEEGVLKQYYIINDAPVDAIMMAILKEG